MSDKREPTFGERLIRGAREAAAHAAGSEEAVESAKVTWRTLTARSVRLRPPTPPSPDRIRQIRDDLDLSQRVFAALLNVSASTVRAWEQGQRTPQGPSVRLLEIAEHHPTAFLIMVDQGATRSSGEAKANREHPERV